MSKTTFFTIIYAIIIIGGAALSALGYGDFRPDADLTTLVAAAASLIYAAVAWYINRQQGEQIGDLKKEAAMLEQRLATINRERRTVRPQ